MYRRAAGPVLVLILLGYASETRAQEPLYYRGKEYGSESQYNPLSLILNGSFDIIQLDGHSRRVFRYPYASAGRNVFRQLGDPITQIEAEGWREFIANEVLPFDLRSRGAQWWPNYQLHLIGGGMTYVAMKEWYEAHGVPMAPAASIVTMAAYHVLNEVLENNNVPGLNPDPVSDIYLFDIGGILLFMNDDVAGFFRRTLNLADWSLQPTFLPQDGTLQNNGQYFSMRWRLPFSDRWYIFYMTGMNGLLGLSCRFDDGAAVSFGGGLRARTLRVVEEASQKKTADLVWTAGVFYDHDNSLLASMVVSGLTSNFLTVNIYPGVVRAGSFSPGLWLTLTKDYELLAGITTRWTPGLGFLAR